MPLTWLNTATNIDPYSILSELWLKPFSREPIEPIRILVFYLKLCIIPVKRRQSYVTKMLLKEIRTEMIFRKKKKKNYSNKCSWFSSTFHDDSVKLRTGVNYLLIGSCSEQMLAVLLPDSPNCCRETDVSLGPNHCQCAHVGRPLWISISQAKEADLCSQPADTGRRAADQA